MRDRGILFSAPMVRALLDGRKTMTRRQAFRADGKPTIWQKVKPGDRLWVRETFWPYEDVIEFGVWYSADGVPPDKSDHDRQRPAIHMPRWASRLTLTVTATKAEPLFAITEADLLSEGVYQASEASWTTGDNIYAGSARAAFHGLWERLHGAGSWDLNPDLVAMSFTVEQRNIDPQAIAEARREMP